jgi:[citrate (pro-3S)-lyase] ligase
LIPNSKNNGAIVKNCNPFTNGHKFLIEYAAKQVDNLYIFVVEEDKSNFSFKDRFKLVKEGVKHLDNVTVLSSGRFIISAATFPEYFTKSEKNDIVIDPSSDIKVFAKYIAPSLNILKRFAGTEPNDRITAQYNEAMKLILPQFGMEFIEISRVEAGGQVVSASKVRKLMENKDINEIAKIVPKTTLDYLVELLNTTQSQPALTPHI